MNAVFQEYKYAVDNGKIGKCDVVFVDDLDLPPYVVRPVEFVVETRTKARNTPNDDQR